MTTGKHLHGAILTSTSEELFKLTFRTPLAQVSTEGNSTLAVSHNPQKDAPTVTAYGQRLHVLPLNGISTDPIMLGPAERLTLTHEGPGPIEPLDHTVLPVVLVP